MSLTLISSWGYMERPWGYEVRVDFTDDVTGAIHNEVLTFLKKPSVKELNDSVLARKMSLEDRIAFEVAEASKPPEPTKEELLMEVAVLKAENVTLMKQVTALQMVKGVK